MANGENNGSSAGNRQINANTGVTVGLVLSVFAASGGAFYKAGEVMADLGHLKSYVMDLRTELADVKRTLQRIERQNGGAVAK